MNTEQLLQMIGSQQVQITILNAQLQAVSGAYEQQRQALAENQAKELILPGEEAVIRVPSKRKKQ